MNTTQLPQDVRKCFVQFMYCLANGTLPFVVGHTILPNGSYVDQLFEIPSNFETMNAIYINNVLIDELGAVTDHARAMKRAAQFIRTTMDSDYVADPPSGDWEVEKR